MSLEKDLLQRRMAGDRATLKRNLQSELAALAEKIQQAQQSLSKGDGLDEHLIVNASGLSAYIAKWNLWHDIAPMVDDL